MKKILLNLIVIISLFSFCFFVIRINCYMKEELQQKELNNKIVDIALKETKLDENNKIVSTEVIIDFKALEKENSDIIAWIYSPNTPINYPIVQSKDNDYYLKRLIDKTYNQAGTIFVDYKNSRDFSDFNTIIYGHNMKNDTMFGTLTNYKSQDYYNNHKKMILYTKNRTYEIEIFAGYTTTSESRIYSFPKTKDSNKEIIEEALEKSNFNSDVEVLNEDSIITLSTCSYSFENERYILLGVLRKI